MATKRPAPDDERQAHQEFRKRHRRNGPHKAPNMGPKSFKKAHPVNELKSQIRSLRRLLEHSEGLPAGARIEKERALHNAQHDLDEAQKAKKRNEIIGRWHKVRFFDRQKATKRLKRAKNELKAFEGSAADRAALEQKLDDAEVDVEYAIHYPLEVDYVPLFPTHRKNGEDGGGDSAEGEEGKALERRGDADMWEMVKKCMKDGTLKDLREGRLAIGGGLAEFEAGKPSSTLVRKSVKRKVGDDETSGEALPKRTLANQDNDSDGDGSGGGFFE